MRYGRTELYRLYENGAWIGDVLAIDHPSVHRIGEPETFTLRKDGRFIEEGSDWGGLYVGRARSYYDPSF